MNPSVREQMDVLKQLVVVDEEIRKLDSELGKERDALDTAKRELEKLRSRVEVARGQYDQIDADRGARVFEGRSLQAQVERSREKLSRTRNEKESNAVTREIEETRKLLRDAEEAAGKRLLELDDLKKRIHADEDDEAQILERIGTAEGAVSAKMREIEAARAEHVTAREALQTKVPNLVLRKYDNVRIKRGSGAARMLSGRCVACNMQVPPQLAQRIQRIDILEPCPSCTRYLWVERPAPAQPTVP